MTKLNQTGTNLFHIIDNYGCEVNVSKEELEELYQQIGKIKDRLPQKKESSHTIILENDRTNEKVQMELSDSAYKLLYYLYEEYWLDSDDIRLTEIETKDFERFI